jgi:uncharacterized protein (TIGR03492 family)
MSSSRWAVPVRYYIQGACVETFTAPCYQFPRPHGTVNVMSGHNILIVSNGYGEDAVGNALAAALRAQGADVRAYPLVGLGHAYRDVRLGDPRRVLPSGGFAFRGSWKLILADLRAGAWDLWRRQRNAFREQRGRYSHVVAIGDAYCLWMAAQVATPIVFVDTAHSEYHDPQGWLVRNLIRRCASVTYVRDRLTADALTHHGIKAQYAGNPLMDVIENGRSPSYPAPVVALLPGSRDDAATNLATLLQLCNALRATRPVTFVCALAPTVSRESILRAVQPMGWQEQGGQLASGEARVLISRTFGPAIRASDVVVGLAGTANEQAAGLGKPVVAFPTTGAQYTARFMRLQHRLLGDALVPVRDWRDAVSSVLRLLDDSSERAWRGQAGRERMGQSGAVHTIAAALLAHKA